MINYDRVQQAFAEYPMCTRTLSQRINHPDHAHAVCAVGALIVSTGAATPAELENVETGHAIRRYFDQLQATYGFETEEQVRELVFVNDDANKNPDPVLLERIHLLDEEHDDRMFRARSPAARDRVEEWYGRQRADLELEFGAEIYQALVAHVEKWRPVAEAKQGRQVARGECRATHPPHQP